MIINWNALKLLASAIFVKGEDVKNHSMNSSNIYDAAKSCLNNHVTLDPSVPADVGCAEAVSYVLKKAGIAGIPTPGIPGTIALNAWLQAHFTPVTVPQAGDIVMSPSNPATGAHGHTGIVLKYGIASNNSATGLFQENYTLDSWNAYFSVKNGFPVLFYRAVEN